MQAKTIVGAAVLAVSCLVGGAVLSDRVLASDRNEEHAAELAALRGRLDAESRELETLRGAFAEQKKRRAARVSELTREVADLRGRLTDKDRAIAELNDRVRDLLAAAEKPSSDPSVELDRKERWKKIQAALTPVLELLKKMDEAENQFELGPQLVAALGKLGAEQFDEIIRFDADETDPYVVGDIRAVMMQALIFVKDVGPRRDAYMERYLERARNGGYGEQFTEQALRRISFSMPPFVDAYAKIVQPLDDDVKRKFLETALDRAARGKSESLRADGVVFLGRTDDPRVTAELMRVFAQTTNSQRLRLTALNGLSTRGDENVLRFLRDAAAGEQDAKVQAEVEKAADKVAQLVAARK
jgi:hypothetical protein